MGRYSYSQPSSSDDYGLHVGYSSEEIVEDEAESGYNNGGPVYYPPQPETEFGFPKRCYCGDEPLLETCYSHNDPGRRFYTCGNRDDGEMHVWKWWDVAVMEEMRAKETLYEQVAQKVDHLTSLSAYETQLIEVKEHQNQFEQKFVNMEKLVSELAREKPMFTIGSELAVVVCFTMLVLLVAVFMFNKLAHIAN